MIDSLYQQDSVTYTVKSEVDDVAKVFVDSLEDTINQIYNQFTFPKKMIFYSNDRKNFKAATSCHIHVEGRWPRTELETTVI